MIVTIDGPAGTGKSTVARKLSELLEFQFLDTGAMYRMVALKVLRTGLLPSNHEAITRLTSVTNMELTSDSYLMDKQEVGHLIRSPEVTEMASIVAQIPTVRQILVSRQREIASHRNIVCEGRDQGTVAFPHAEFKYFLTADPEERARRRFAELSAAGQEIEVSDLLRDQLERDSRDANRAASPLKPADDAIIFDTTQLGIDEVVRHLADQIRSKYETPR